MFAGRRRNVRMIMLSGWRVWAATQEHSSLYQKWHKYAGPIWCWPHWIGTTRQWHYWIAPTSCVHCLLGYYLWMAQPQWPYCMGKLFSNQAKDKALYLVQNLISWNADSPSHFIQNDILLGTCVLLGFGLDEMLNMQSTSYKTWIGDMLTCSWVYTTVL